LAEWARAVLASEQTVSLRTLVNHADNADFAVEIEKLEVGLYKKPLNDDVSFDFKTLIELLKPLRQKLLKGSPTKQVGTVLPALYPE